MTIPLATSSSCVATKTIPCSSRTWSMFSSFSRIVSHSSSSSSAQRPLNSSFIDQKSCRLLSQIATKWLRNVYPNNSRNRLHKHIFESRDKFTNFVLCLCPGIDALRILYCAEWRLPFWFIETVIV
jgi:hypothetical protein